MNFNQNKSATENQRTTLKCPFFEKDRFQIIDAPTMKQRVPSTQSLFSPNLSQSNEKQNFSKKTENLSLTPRKNLSIDKNLNKSNNNGQGLINPRIVESVNIRKKANNNYKKISIFNSSITSEKEVSCSESKFFPPNNRHFCGYFKPDFYGDLPGKSPNKVNPYNSNNIKLKNNPFFHSDSKNYINENIFQNNNNYCISKVHQFSIKNLYNSINISKEISKDKTQRFQKKKSVSESPFIPDEYLTIFDLVSLDIKPISSNRKYYDRDAQFDKNTFQNFIDNICQKVVLNEPKNISIFFSGNNFTREKSKILNKNNKKLKENNIKEKMFINRKRSNSFVEDFEEKCKEKFKELKNMNKISKIKKNKIINENYKIFKNKINERKNIKKLIKIKKKKLKENNGRSKKYFISQIQIKEKCLCEFPLFQLENEENLKVEIRDNLLLEKRDFIKVSEQFKLKKIFINENSLENFSFEILYKRSIDKEKKEYRVNIQGKNILKLIKYYYFTIREHLKNINKSYYSHNSFLGIFINIEKLSCLIKNCNTLSETINKLFNNININN